ncbi:MAG: hypothetical protein ACOZQL_36365 [Myxococcota bacterium]
MGPQRQSLEATLRSDFGEQRLVRSGMNLFNRMSLVPREPLQLMPVVWVDWRDGAFGLEVREAEWWPVVMNGARLPAGRHALHDGQRFTVGQTELRYHFTRRTWPVDLERERALLVRDDDAAWAIYADELLTREDPLGAVLARSPAPDVVMGLEVQPLLARHALSFVADARGLWREVTFRHELTAGALWGGALEAVLTHPIAWFVHRVTLALTPAGRDFRQALVAQAQQSALDVGRAASPHLRELHVPRLPPRAALPSPREGVRVSR